MNPSDEVEDLLVKAGEQWRSEQPSAPEPDLHRITGGGHRSTRRWVPALAAASVAVVATAALLVLPESGGAGNVAEPVQILASGNNDPSNLLVRNGDRVEVQGQVIAAPGNPVVFCKPMSQPAIFRPGPTPPPSCRPPQQVELTGVDLDRLSIPSTIQGVRSGLARLVGVWTDGSIAVQEQSAPRFQEEESAEVPCAPPPGGWPTPKTEGGGPTPALEAFVKARPDQLSALWIGWPEGGRRADSPNASASLKPSVVMVGVAHGDVNAIRTAVEPLYAGSLCVYRARFSQNEVKQLAAAVDALPLEQFGVTYSSGWGVGDRPVSVDLMVLDEKALAVLSPIGLDKLDVNPEVKPVR
ncbi:MAG TPA: hypothetical protein VGD71_19365 [Kribbella sp.]